MRNYHFAAFGRLAPEFKQLIDSEYTNQLQCTVFDNADELAIRIKDFDAYAGFSIPDFVSLDAIRWIHSFGAGVDAFTQRQDIAPQALITRTSGNMGARMAEYCLAYILHDLKQIELAQEQQGHKNWSPLPLPDLADQRILIFGTGSIGSAIARMLKPLCKGVTGVNQSGNTSGAFLKAVKLEEAITIGLQEYHILINTLPLTNTTTSLFDHTLFATCKEALFINVGRGASVNTPDLVEAIDKKMIRKAVLDVFNEEPLPRLSILWEHPQIIVTPHHASKTSVNDMEESFRAIYVALQQQTSSPLIVNFDRGY